MIRSQLKTILDACFRQGVDDAETLVSLRAQVKKDDELAQWQQLADRELASLAHFTKEGEGRLQRSSSNLQTAQAADERTSGSSGFSISIACQGAGPA